MSNSFENKLQGKLKNHEGLAGKEHWENIAQKLDKPFETTLKSRLNGFEPVVASSLWAGIESNLPGSLESGLQSKFHHFEATPSATVWAGITNSVEAMPGTFEQKIAEKMLDFSALAPANGINGIFAELDQKKAFNLKRAIISIAAIFLLFTTFLFIPKNAQLPLANYNKASFLETFEATKTTPATYSSDIENLSTNSLNNFIENTSTFTTNSNNYLSHNSGKTYRTNHNNQTTDDNLVSASSQGQFEPFLVDQIALNTLKGIEESVSLPKQVDLGFNSFVLEDPKKEPFAFGLYTSSGSFALQNRSNTSQSFYNKEFANFQNELYQKGLYTSIGTNLSFPIAENVSITSGLGITSARQTIAFDIYKKDVPSSYNSLTNNGNLVTNSYNPQSNLLSRKKTKNESSLSMVDEAEIEGDSIIAGNTFQVSNSFLMVDIPLGFETKIIERKKSSLGLRIGAKFRIMASANSYHLTLDRSRIVEVSPAISQVFYHSSLVGFSALTYNHQVSQNLEISVGPEVNLNVSDINKSGTWMSMRPFQLGFQIGIRQKV